jgi:hypothetical protein
MVSWLQIAPHHDWHDRKSKLQNKVQRGLGGKGKLEVCVHHVDDHHNSNVTGSRARVGLLSVNESFEHYKTS